MKKSITITSLLLICTLMLSSTPTILGNYASATTCAANCLPNYYWAGLDNLTEMALSEEVADYIAVVLNSRYPLYNPRSENCTATDFKNFISYLQGYDTAVIYSKGHLAWKTCTYGNEHMGLSMYNGTSVWDYEIYPLTSSKNVHSFIWHCQTGLIPSGSISDACGCRGLPKAFTQNNSIQLWGTSGNQVYLGWTNEVPSYNPLSGGSPQYSWSALYSYTYSQIAIKYYYYMSQGYTTAEALVEMSYNVYGVSFEYSDLVGWLVLYGNMYARLP